MNLSPDQIAQLEALVKLGEKAPGEPWREICHMRNDHGQLSYRVERDVDGDPGDNVVLEAYQHPEAVWPHIEWADGTLEWLLAAANARPALAQLLAAWREAEIDRRTVADLRGWAAELGRPMPNAHGLDVITVVYDIVQTRAQVAEADCAALQKLMRRIVESNISVRDTHLASCDNVDESCAEAEDALAQPHPGQALLDRLARAEGVVEAAKEVSPGEVYDAEDAAAWSMLQAALAAVERKEE